MDATKGKALDAVTLMTLLRRHRLATGLSQTKLAKTLKVTPGAISQWESGATMPAPEMFPKLARIFGINAMELTRVISPDTKELASTAK